MKQLPARIFFMYFCVAGFVGNLEKMSLMRIFNGYINIVTILDKGGCTQFVTILIHGGDLPNLLQYYIGEEGLSEPQICIT